MKHKINVFETFWEKHFIKKSLSLPAKYEHTHEKDTNSHPCNRNIDAVHGNKSHSGYSFAQNL